jgi:hypothetical protein
LLEDDVDPLLEEPVLPVEPEEPVEPEPVELESVDPVEPESDGWLFVGAVEPPVEPLPPSCCSCWVAGSGVPVVLEQATRLPDNNRAAALRKNHFLFI